MAAYSLSFKPSVEKDLRDLPKTEIPRVMQRIGELAENPLAHGSRKLVSAERFYRVRVGDYRIVYEVDSPSKLVIIHYVRHRRDVYRAIS